MAKRVYGCAGVVHPNLRSSDWPDFLADSARKRRIVARCSSTRQSIVDVASDIVGERFNPAEYVLSHATIVASVDTYKPKSPDAPLSTSSIMSLGKLATFDFRSLFHLMQPQGFRPNRKYADFRITRPTQKFVNDNNDAFSRGVLLKSYRTFVGAFNFIEHVQVEALSKGRILDAAIRNIGPTLYVDILVATHKAHEELCAGILDGSVDKMSMGCDVVGTICSCCGHWSIDDTELCPCIRHFKGQMFNDEDGEPSRVAEICGHESIDPTGGVVFKEASWVEGPAFKGAVSRGVLEPPEGTVPEGRVARKKVVPGSWKGGAPRTAAHRVGEEDAPDFGGDDAPPAEGDDASAEGDDSGASAPSKSEPLDDAISQVQNYIYQRAVDRIREHMDEGGVRDTVPGAPDDNDNLTQLASRQGADFRRRAVASFALAAKDDGAFLRGLPGLLQGLGASMSPQFAAAIGRAAPLFRAGRRADFLTRCGLEVGRPLRRQEAEMALRIARLLPGSRPTNLNSYTLPRSRMSGREPG